jgi:2-succinyl-5-enolpyruvyl-6-hydroxy-3-cyclohexene-1-carboxylate synthase
MRECRSGQTIDQQKLFGSHVNFYHEFAVPQASLPMLRYLRQTAAQAWERAFRSSDGPVHLNAPFRDPLPPIEDGKSDKLRDELDGRTFFSALGPVPRSKVVLQDTVKLGGRGVIVAGQHRSADPVAYAKAVGRISRRLGWPVLADTLSPLRNHARFVPDLITAYDTLARSELLMQRLQPDHVLCLHDWPVSKALRHWIGVADAPVTFVRPDGQNPDALHGRTCVLRCQVEDLAEHFQVGAKSPGWLLLWRKAGRKATASLARQLGALDWMFEGRAAGLLPGLLPRGTPLFVANSMPVRDLDFFWAANNRGHEVHCNRGANGIDGTLSTALGLAHGSDRPAVLLTGDLALLHDTNGFLSIPKFRGSLTIVLINNQGGGIFEHLPVTNFDPPFEEFFATPQAAHFRRLCAVYGVAHVVVKDWRHFARLLVKLPARGVRVFEVRTDRKRDAAFRGTLFDLATKQTERALRRA